MNILFLDNINLDSEEWITLNKSSDINILPFRYSESIDPEYYSVVDLIVSRYSNLSAKMLSKFKNLKFVVLASVTYRWVDLQYCRQNAITVCNCPTYNTSSTANFAISQALSLLSYTQIFYSIRNSGNGIWHMGGTQRSDISGKVAVVIGKGNIGSKIEARLNVFEVQTFSFNSKSSIKEIEHSLSFADIVFIAVPLTKNTKNYFSSERLSLLKKGCILVSISPGEVIDEESLYNCLKDKKIGGAVLDSFQGEPFDEPSNMFLEFSKLKNVFTTQHVAWNTDYSEKMLQIELSKTVESCLSGLPINVVREVSEE